MLLQGNSCHGGLCCHEGCCGQPEGRPQSGEPCLSHRPHCGSGITDRFQQMVAHPSGNRYSFSQSTNDPLKSLSVYVVVFFVFHFSAIQNAPNPGGGEGQAAPVKSSPAKAQPHGGSGCRDQRTCSKGSCSDAPTTLGRVPSVQIENTPLLCPFHLQPVSE